MFEPGTYYKCLRGDSQHLAVAEPESFAVRDARGRDWICFPVSEEDAEQLDLRQHVADVRQADATLRKHGLSQEGTEVRIYFCADETELRDKLAEDLA